MVCMLYMYKLYRQKKVKNFEKKLEEVASPGFVKSLRGLMDFSTCSACSFTRGDPGVYHWPCNCGKTSCAMLETRVDADLFCQLGSRHMGLSQPASNYCEYLGFSCN